MIDSQAAGGQGLPAAARRTGGWVRWRAEVVLAAHVLAGGRAMRLVVLLVASFAVLLGSSSGTLTVGSVRQFLVLAAGVVGATAGAIAFEPGASCFAVRRAAAPAWVHASGRWVAVLTLVVGAVVATGAAAVVGGGRVSAAFVGAALLFGGATAGMSAAFAPHLGSSAAGAVGLVTVWFGFVPPQLVASVLDGWPPAANGLSWLWHIVPMPWRAEQISVAPEHAAHLGLWLVGGPAVAVLGALQRERDGV